jgi:hypothetical protein
MHSTEDGKDGIKNWLEIEEKLNLPMDCKFVSRTCCVSTPSNGFHLYYKTEETLKFNSKIPGTESVDILYTKAVNVAGSVKAGKEYSLEGSLGKIPGLPDELKKTDAKTDKNRVAADKKRYQFSRPF